MGITKRILVLEDEPVRIETLTGWFPGVEIRSHKDPTDFTEAAKFPHDLVIFDHDLGIESSGYMDPTPTNGLDAAGMYTPSVVVPAIIWSVNPGGSERIEQCLRQKGIPCCRIPFLKVNFDRLKSLISSILGVSSS